MQHYIKYQEQHTCKIEHGNTGLLSVKLNFASKVCQEITVSRAVSDHFRTLGKIPIGFFTFSNAKVAYYFSMKCKHVML